uniref:Uncharacterized protein n=1 Tax=Amphimedon queenslandica TaxID=400682 RepID=A0A1X7UZF4_AMPQE
MKYLLLCLLSAIACTHACDDIAKSSLVGHWTFEEGKKLKDLTGNFADILLKGARIENGKLIVHRQGWAVSPKYTGPTISEKTLVSWVRLTDTRVRAGSALTIDKISVDEFDAIVYGEREANRWMSGSSFFRRTTDPRPGYIGSTNPVQIAITYQNMRGSVHVRLYVNGRLFGRYTKGYIAIWSRGDTEVFWGIRHGNTNGGPGRINAEIEESRIYTTVLKPQELVKLRLNK